MWLIYNAIYEYVPLCYYVIITENIECFSYFWSVLPGGIRVGLPEEVPWSWIWGNKNHCGEDINPTMVPWGKFCVPYFADEKIIYPPFPSPVSPLHLPGHL